MFDKTLLKQKLNLTIDELNEHSLQEFREARPDMIGTEHDKPGGFMAKPWNEFMSQYKDGDEIWIFETPSWTWASLCGRAGYVIMRNGEYVAGFCTKMN